MSALQESGRWSLRQAPRVPFRADVYWDGVDGAERNGSMIDISETGLSFMAADPIPAGSNLLLRISAPEWSVSALIRVVYANRIERTRGESSARIGAVFLNLSETERDAIAKLVRRTHEEAFRDARPEQEQKPSTILAEFETQVVSAWLAFLLRPERFDEPPPVSTLTRAELRRAVAQLGAEEAACLRGGVEDATARWEQAWTALAARIRCAVDRGFSGAASTQWQEQAPALLELLLGSLAESQRAESEWSPETRGRVRRAALKTVVAGLALRDLAVTRALELDPEVMRRLRELEGQATPAPVVAAKRRTPHLGRVLAIVIITIGAVASAIMWKRQRHRTFAAVDYAALSTVLASAQVSTGNGPRVLLGQVANDKWAQLDPQQRRSEADRLRQALQRQGIASGVVYAGAQNLAIHIEQGSVVYVDAGSAP